MTKLHGLAIETGSFFEGNLRAACPIQLKGRFRGLLVSTEDVHIARGAVLEGTVAGSDIHVDGRALGNIYSHRKVAVSQNGIVVGRITAPGLDLHDKAIFDGIWRVWGQPTILSSYVDEDQPSSTPDSNENLAFLNFLNTLGLSEDPFRDCPQQKFYYSCEQHEKCLSKLELSLRLDLGLKHSLYLVLGEPGAGKTVLSEQLLFRLAQYGDVDLYYFPHLCHPDFNRFLSHFLMLSDPVYGFESGHGQVAKKTPAAELKRRLADSGKRIVLLVDDAHHVSDPVLDTLTDIAVENSTKLGSFHIVLFGLGSLEDTIKRHHRLSHIVGLTHHLPRLSFSQTQELIEHRLSMVAMNEAATKIFTPKALRTIHQYSNGVPAKIVQLCHSILVKMAVRKQSKAGWLLSRNCARSISAIADPKHC